MKAMILAAGLGTRLRPLTTITPKPLMPVANRPLIDRLIDHLIPQGVDEIVVNAHHHGKKLIHHLDLGRPFGIRLQVAEEPQILGTGGGLKNTEGFWDDEPFILINGDIITDIDIRKALETHRKAGSIATLILHDYGQFNKISIDERGLIREIPRNKPEKSAGSLAFTGIHILEKGILDHIPWGVFHDIIDCYRDLLAQGIPIAGHLSKGHYWRDLGTPESYMDANREIIHPHTLLIGKGSEPPRDISFSGWAVIGENVRIGKGVSIENSVIWDNCRIGDGLSIRKSIVAQCEELNRSLDGEIY